MAKDIVPTNGKDPVAIARHKLGTVEFMRSSAYTDLNSIAQVFGKRIDNWTRLKTTKQLFEEFKSDPVYGGAEPIITSTGGFKGLPSDLREVPDRGTFAHPDIAIQFAQWCSPGFALWVSRQIRHLMTYGEVNLHYTEWSDDDYFRGLEYNRDDNNDLW